MRPASRRAEKGSLLRLAFAFAYSQTQHRWFSWFRKCISVPEGGVDLFERDPCPCFECGIPIAPLEGPSEWYMLEDEVWNSVALPDEMLCIGCVEGRLGRKLSGSDFAAVMENDPNLFDLSERLVSRLG